MPLPKTARIQDAIALATSAHKGQFRKGTGKVPYIRHPLRVAERVASITDDEEMIVAALLHDVLEDTDTPASLIKERFGSRVTVLVHELTATPTPLGRKERKLLEAFRLGLVSSEAQTIKYADILDNLQDIFEFSPAFAKTYIPEKTAIFSEMTRGNATLRKELGLLLEHLKQELNKIETTH